MTLKLGNQDGPVSFSRWLAVALEVDPAIHRSSSFHLKRLMMLEPCVVYGNPERLKYWPNLRWIAIQL
jgi:hypothetical protein